MAILPNLAQMQAELELLRAQNALLKANASKPKKITMKVSEKGAISFYGMGRFPVTLYKSQVEALLAITDEIKQFVADNEDLLKTKT